MYTPQTIYNEYRKSQAHSKNRGYRLPKDWNYFWNEKLTVNQRTILERMADYFNTKWCDISLELYMDSGFEVYKNFTYHQFFDKKIIKKYISKDKAKKNNSEKSKEELINSTKFYKLNYKSLHEYTLKSYNSMMKQIIKDYIDNKISAIFLVWTIKLGFLKLTEEEKSMCPYVVEQFNNINKELNNLNGFLTKLKGKL